MVSLFNSKKLSLIIGMLIIINNLSFLYADSATRSIIEETDDGSMVAATSSASNGESYQAGTDGLLDSEVTSTPTSSDSDSTSSSESQYYAEDSESSNESSEMFQVSHELLSVQESMEELNEAYQLTESSLESQKSSMLNQMSELKSQLDTIESTLENSEESIKEEETTKKEAEANIQTAATNVSKLEKTELEILEQIVPVKEKLNQLTSALKKIQEAKVEQTTVLEENKSKLDQSTTNISRQMYDERTAQVNKTDIVSQISELNNKVEKIDQQIKEQKQKYDIATKALNKKLVDEISKHGIGQKATCPVKAIKRIKQTDPDDFIPTIKPQALAVQAEEVISNNCVQSCVCKTKEIPQSSVSSINSKLSSESSYPIYPPIS